MQQLWVIGLVTRPDNPNQTPKITYPLGNKTGCEYKK